AGSAFPVPRDLLRDELGFARISDNSIDAVGDRDFVAETLFAVTMISTHLSRLAEDLIIFGSSEFGFVRFGDTFSTGSSMMPQKRNPDALELARGSAARAGGDLYTVLTTLKGLPSGYNKDLQEDKRALFDAVDMIRLVLAAVDGAVAELRFDGERMKMALSSGLMATDLADYLVTKGVSFRDAHAAVGTLVRESEEAGCDLSSLSDSSFHAAHPLFAEDAQDWLGADMSLSRREIPGGTGPDSVQRQLESARKILGSAESASA
ncbi:MAG: argininosuccinate lyase, partial [Gemmatimonadota bacterium]|nr:argininosuccinate lyase [Gemmatimonadota bacterium]